MYKECVIIYTKILLRRRITRTKKKCETSMMPHIYYWQWQWAIYIHSDTLKKHNYTILYIIYLELSIVVTTVPKITCDPELTSWSDMTLKINNNKQHMKVNEGKTKAHWNILKKTHWMRKHLINAQKLVLNLNV